jgi:protein SCO1
MGSKQLQIILWGAADLALLAFVVFQLGLGADAALVQPLFIAIDPARDRALGLTEFTKAFHPAIIGLAGTDAATQAAADSFKVYFARTDDAASLDGYTMAHSPDLYLIGPDGD